MRVISIADRSKRGHALGVSAKSSRIFLLAVLYLVCLILFNYCLLWAPLRPSGATYRSTLRRSCLSSSRHRCRRRGFFGRRAACSGRACDTARSRENSYSFGSSNSSDTHRYRGLCQRCPGTSPAAPAPRPHCQSPPASWCAPAHSTHSQGCCSPALNRSNQKASRAFLPEIY